ncbi:type II secretion system protein N [Limnohabitans sp.]|jgi:general secretion pathway protein C|uniref:type II secretion system protein N n=1 Tax=Limnohabitans sp. TaxID=1907725 RepID=UPI0039BD6FC5|nr:general secretion pathway protein C [Comamonadaceae bacterium]
MFQIHNKPVQVFRLNAFTALIWCAAAAGLVFWVLKFPTDSGARPTPVTATPIVSSVLGPDAASQTARVWGVQSALPEVSMALSSRFQLLGVIANASGHGSALIAVDGQAPKAYRVGQTLTDGVTLINLSARQANLGPASGGAGGFSLAMPSQGNSP